MSDGLHVTIEDDDDAAASARIADSNRRYEEATREADQYRAETARLRRQTAVDRVAVDLATTEAEIEAARGALYWAKENGDFASEVAAQEKLTSSVTKRENLTARAEAIQRQPMPQTFEDHLSRFTPRTADWMRRNRDWVMDPGKSNRLQSAHHVAVARGLEPDTDEYFDHVERTIGLRSGGGRSSSGRVAADVDPRRPVSSDGRTVLLTKGERERAIDGTLTWNYGPNRGKPIGIQEMARRKAAMVAEGRYNRLGES